MCDLVRASRHAPACECECRAREWQESTTECTVSVRAQRGRTPSCTRAAPTHVPRRGRRLSPPADRVSARNGREVNLTALRETEQGAHVALAEERVSRRRR